jgi:hypothetical protein
MTMKSQIIFVGIAIMLITGIIAYFRIRAEDNRNKEAEWFVNHLNYDFCATPVEIELLSQKWGYGYVTCRLDPSNKINFSVEDSLAQSIKHHKELRFITFRNGNEIKFLTQGASSVPDIDKVCVHSKDNKIEFYYNDKIVSVQHLLYCLKNEKVN